jgi:hypothetical protein
MRGLIPGLIVDPVVVALVELSIVLKLQTMTNGHKTTP